MERVVSHCYAWQPPGRLAQLGERHLDKAEVTGSSPVSPTERSAFAGLLCSWFESSSLRPSFGGAGWSDLRVDRLSPRHERDPRRRPKRTSTDRGRDPVRGNPFREPTGVA